MYAFNCFGWSRMKLATCKQNFALTVSRFRICTFSIFTQRYFYGNHLYRQRSESYLSLIVREMTVVGKHKRVCPRSFLRSFRLRPGQDPLLFHSWQVGHTHFSPSVYRPLVPLVYFHFVRAIVPVPGSGTYFFHPWIRDGDPESEWKSRHITESSVTLRWVKY